MMCKNTDYTIEYGNTYQWYGLGNKISQKGADFLWQLSQNSGVVHVRPPTGVHALHRIGYVFETLFRHCCALLDKAAGLGRNGHGLPERGVT